MRPLSKEEENEAEVTWEDQKNINTFSKLHSKLLDLQDRLTEKNVPNHESTCLSIGESKFGICELLGYGKSIREARQFVFILYTDLKLSVLLCSLANASANSRKQRILD